jgi:hypothetical protein
VERREGAWAGGRAGDAGGESCACGGAKALDRARGRQWDLTGGDKISMAEAPSNGVTWAEKNLGAVGGLGRGAAASTRVGEKTGPIELTATNCNF